MAKRKLSTVSRTVSYPNDHTLYFIKKHPKLVFKGKEETKSEVDHENSKNRQTTIRQYYSPLIDHNRSEDEEPMDVDEEEPVVVKQKLIPEHELLEWKYSNLCPGALMAVGTLPRYKASNLPDFTSLTRFTDVENEQFRYQKVDLPYCLIFIPINKEEDFWMVVSYEQGYRMIKSKECVYDFGLKTGLNSVKPNGLKKVKSHKMRKNPLMVAQNVARASHQDDFLKFFDDIVRGIEGDCKNDQFATNFKRGGVSLTLTKKLNKPDDLITLCHNAYNGYTSLDYKENFAWIDNIRPVQDDLILATLNTDLEKQFQLALENKKVSNELQLICPVEENDEINFIGFGSSSKTRSVHAEISISGYIKELQNFGIKNYSIGTFFKTHRIQETNEDPKSWPIKNCVIYKTTWKTSKDGEPATYDEYLYYLGKWLKLSTEWFRPINETLKNLEKTWNNFTQENGFSLPVALKAKSNEKAEDEPAYCKRVESINKNFICLDNIYAKTSILMNPKKKKNSAVHKFEACDLAVIDQREEKKICLIHVKQDGDELLNKLFNQGANYTKILLNEPKFQMDVKNNIGKLIAAKKRNNEPHMDDFVDLIPNPEERRVKPEDLMIVFAIMKRREDAESKSKLSLCHQMNLHRCATYLKRKGIQVGLAFIGRE
uniref:Uncharacterized protein n=1 Tax=Acrobeloides nanus TaxID=290746 RepID=A0A914C0D3_9BILA